MAYFPNGTSGLMYQERYCENCCNWRNLGDGRDYGCPIMDLHMLLNYNQKEHKAILNMFIPMDKDGIYAGECLMFLRK